METEEQHNLQGKNRTMHRFMKRIQMESGKDKTVHFFCIDAYFVKNYNKIITPLNVRYVETMIGMN